MTMIAPPKVLTTLPCAVARIAKPSTPSEVTRNDAGLSGTLCIWRDLKVCRGWAVKEDRADEQCNEFRVC